MDIQLRFADGSTELRDADSPCLPALFDPPSRHPSDGRWYLYFPGDKHPFSFCGITVRTLASQRGWGETYIWRITGRNDVSKALTGGWQSCQVETTDEQIDRLTRERDEARRAYALSLTSLRNPADFEEWKRLRAKASKEGWLP